MHQRALDYKKPSPHLYMPITWIIFSLVFSAMIPGTIARDHAAKIFSNMTYHVPDAENKDVTLQDGKYVTRDDHVIFDGKYVYDDFNHDGLKDAAVIITTHTGGGGNQSWDVLAFLINDGKKLVHRASIDLDDRSEIFSLNAKEGKVLITMNVHQPGDCNGGPSKQLKEWYEYPGPDVFTSRAGSYIWGESLDGVQGTPDNDFKAPFIPQLGRNHGFISGVFDEHE
ncbi:MAG: hypothetical protein HQL20_10235 [Candidatus Omnitrophica bacterium]|nr:hypothetical protein [Candidatus Omnitrophota bacterium]